MFLLVDLENIQFGYIYLNFGDVWNPFFNQLPLARVSAGCVATAYSLS